MRFVYWLHALGRTALLVCSVSISIFALDNLATHAPQSSQDQRSLSDNGCCSKGEALHTPARAIPNNARKGNLAMFVEAGGRVVLGHELVVDESALR